MNDELDFLGFVFGLIIGYVLYIVWDTYDIGWKLRRIFKKD